MLYETIRVPDMPAVAGLAFRKFEGEADYPAMVDVLNDSAVVDETEEIYTVELLAHEYAHLINCDPSKDLLIAEVDGRLVGFARVSWWVNDAGERLYGLNCQLHSSQCGKGIGQAMLRWQEQRARTIASDHSTVEPRYFQTFTLNTMPARMALLESEGYAPVRFSFMMVRPSLADVPDAWPLPEGLETRPVQPEHMRAIWEAMDEAFRDHWGHRPGTEEGYQQFLNWPDATPHLWQVGWDVATNQVAGMVLNEIFPKENERFGRKRGWTDPICVRRPWRRRGLARALIMRSLKVLRDNGMTDAALGVDTQNPSNALHLYESCGYEPVRRGFTMRKAM
jgi:mycothiol synthase